MRKCIAATTLVCALIAGSVACAAVGDALLEQARAGMRKAGEYWATQVASHGGYVWIYSGADIVSIRRGEAAALPLSVVWVQAGTPMVGEAFLHCYEATGEKLYLDAAVAAAHCLAWGQLESGGWTYSIGFDLTYPRYRFRYHHLGPESTPLGAGYTRLRNISVFDDNTTQSATTFLMAMDRYVDDPVIDAAIQRALAMFLNAQYKGGRWDGAWPFRYPVKSDTERAAAKRRENLEKGFKGLPTETKTGPFSNLPYGHLPTFNDNAMADCARTMLAAWKQYRKAEHLDSVKRCLEFYLRAQLPDPQGGWAQQYEKDLAPAWGRAFEPPAVSGYETASNMTLMQEMYVEFGDKRYLESVARAAAWYRRSVIGKDARGRDLWARFYEIGTNKPLYCTKAYPSVVTYSDADLRGGYTFKAAWGIRPVQAYDEMVKVGLEEHRKKLNRQESIRTWEARANRVLGGQDELGRWVRMRNWPLLTRDANDRVIIKEPARMRPLMYSNTFAQNMQTLADYIIEAQGGPKVTPPQGK